LKVEAESPRFDAGKLEELRRHLGQRIHFGLNLIDEPAGRRRIVQRAIQQSLGQGFERGQRGTELVRKVADEIAPHRFKAPDATVVTAPAIAAASPCTR